MIIKRLLLLVLLAVLPSLYDLLRDRVMFLPVFTVYLFVLMVCLVVVFGFKGLILSTVIFVFYKPNFVLVFDIISSVYGSLSPRLLRENILESFGKLGTVKYDFSKLNHKPHIILMNYSSDRLESALPLVFPKPFAFFMRKHFYDLFKMKNTAINCFYRTTDGNSYDETKNQIEKLVKKEDKYVVLYANQSPYIRHSNGGKLHSGIFRISQELGIPITLMAVDYLETNLGRIKKQELCIELGHHFEIPKDESIERYVNLTKKIFRDILKRFEKNKK